MAQTQGTYVINDFSGGIQSANANPLAWPNGAIWDGRNFIIKNRGLVTRKGFKEVYDFATDLPIIWLRQIFFPSYNQSYFLTQYRYVSGETTYDKLAYSVDSLPADPLTMSWLGDFSSTAPYLDVDTLGDRCLFVAPGVRSLVFSGGTTSDGSDWPVPKQVMAQWDSSNYTDISSEMCDSDDSTFFVVGSGTTRTILVCSEFPTLLGLYIDVGEPNTSTATSTIYYWDGSSWQATGWTDYTATAGKTLAQSGKISGSAQTSSAQTIAQVPGYWFKISLSSGVDATTILLRTRICAPTQYLQNISDGIEDISCGVMHYINASKSMNDLTISLSDYMTTSVALNDGNVDTPTGWTASDYVYIGYPSRFNKLNVELAPNLNNLVSATLSAEYYKRGTWTSLSITDGTAVSGKTMAKSGAITFNAPSNDDWSRVTIGDPAPVCYWIRLKVNATLSAQLEWSELHVLPVDKPLRQHSHMFRFRDRIVMLGDTANPAQIDISRKLETYGWSGSDTWANIMAGSDAVIAAFEAYNQGWIFRTRDLYILNGYSPETFSLERAEIAGRAPVNAQVIVKAPVIESDDKSKMGFYFLSHEGMFHFTGLQLYDLSQQVPWFLSDETPCLDHNFLHLACGAYLPLHRWIVWAVPMKFGASAQTTNNVLLVYDLQSKCWFPPMLLSASCLCVARDDVSGAPGRAGRERLYIGTNDGKILEVFGEDDDDGTVIAPWFETGWMDFQWPGIPKRITAITIYGTTEGTSITLKLYKDGNDSEYQTLETMENLPPNVIFARNMTKENFKSYFTKARIEAEAPTEIYAIEFEYSVAAER